jgi:hypothetical protein
MTPTADYLLLPVTAVIRPSQAFDQVRDRVRIPLYGCDCYAYGLLAAGHVDLVVEADLKPYDYMALVPIIQVGCCVCCGCWGRIWGCMVLAGGGDHFWLQSTGLHGPGAHHTGMKLKRMHPTSTSSQWRGAAKVAGGN